MTKKSMRIILKMIFLLVIMTVGLIFCGCTQGDELEIPPDTGNTKNVEIEQNNDTEDKLEGAFDEMSLPSKAQRITSFTSAMDKKIKKEDEYVQMAKGGDFLKETLDVVQDKDMKLTDAAKLATTAQDAFQKPTTKTEGDTLTIDQSRSGVTTINGAKDEITVGENATGVLLINGFAKNVNVKNENMKVLINGQVESCTTVNPGNIGVTDKGSLGQLNGANYETNPGNNGIDSGKQAAGLQMTTSKQTTTGGTQPDSGDPAATKEPEIANVTVAWEVNGKRQEKTVADGDSFIARKRTLTYFIPTQAESVDVTVTAANTWTAIGRGDVVEKSAGITSASLSYTMQLSTERYYTSDSFYISNGDSLQNTKKDIKIYIYRTPVNPSIKLQADSSEIPVAGNMENGYTVTYSDTTEEAMLIAQIDPIYNNIEVTSPATVGTWAKEGNIYYLGMSSAKRHEETVISCVQKSSVKWLSDEPFTIKVIRQDSNADMGSVSVTWQVDGQTESQPLLMTDEATEISGTVPEGTEAVQLKLSPASKWSGLSVNNSAFVYGEGLGYAEQTYDMTLVDGRGSCSAIIKAEDGTEKTYTIGISATGEEAEVSPQALNLVSLQMKANQDEAVPTPEELLGEYDIPESYVEMNGNTSKNPTTQDTPQDNVDHPDEDSKEEIPGESDQSQMVMQPDVMLPPEDEPDIN